MWLAPALIDTFGDAFLKGTAFEPSHCAGWSFQVGWERSQTVRLCKLADRVLAAELEELRVASSFSCNWRALMLAGNEATRVRNQPDIQLVWVSLFHHAKPN